MKEALKLALEALRMADELCGGHGVDFKEYGLEFDRDIQVKYKDAITAIKEALAQPEQEPVAWAVVGDGKFGKYEIGQVFVDYEATHIYWKSRGYELVPLYTTPPKRPWVGLTDEEMQALWDRYAHMEMMRAIEAKLKEKNT